MENDEVDPCLFTDGIMYDGQALLSLPIRQAGIPVDFNFADFDLVVTPAWLNERLEAELPQGSIQRIPVAVEGTNDRYEILNVLDKVRCIDESKSECMFWTERDSRPDKIGQYRMITRLVIDPKLAAGHKLFRIEGWEIALVAEQSIVSLLEEAKVTGIVFQKIS